MKINATLEDRFKTEIQIGKHSYILDREETVGGTDAGTSPTNLLMASVLGCKVMVAKAFLDARDLTFDKIETDIDFDITGPNMHPSAEGVVTIKVIGATLDDKTQQQLHRIVETGCPVHNLLDPEKTTIETKIEIEN